MRLPGDEILDLIRGYDPLVQFERPASESEITRGEDRLYFKLPIELREFLSRSDGASLGVRLDSGEVVPEASVLVWSLAEIVENHGSHSLDPAQPSDVLFFSDAGVDGILFGLPIRPSLEVGPEIVAWYPIEDRVEVVAASFRAWLEAWLTGRLAV